MCLFLRVRVPFTVQPALERCQNMNTYIHLGRSLHGMAERKSKGRTLDEKRLLKIYLQQNNQYFWLDLTLYIFRFTTPHHREGFELFLDTIVAMEDVWLVSTSNHFKHIFNVTMI